MPAHADSGFVPYTPAQMFDLVADIEAYPQFLPWCRAARILSRQGDAVRAELVIGFRGVTERYVSRVLLDRGRMEIDVDYEKGPFRHLKNKWKFQEAPEGCQVDFEIDFEFRSRLLQVLIGAMFTEAIRRMTQAFRQRADSLYGLRAKLLTG